MVVRGHGADLLDPQLQHGDGSRPVNMQVNVAATLPALAWIATGLLIGGIIFLVGGILVIVIPVRRAS